MRIKEIATVILLCTCFAVVSFARENNFTVTYDKKTKATIFIFKGERGDVQFNHNLHQDNMKGESCVPCHKTETPTKETTLTRLDQRKAHYFCKGCHHLRGVGPTECHECHKLNRKS